MPQDRRAILYRMVLPDHVCPFGLRARDRLVRAGYDVDDRTLTSRDAVDAIKAEFGVDTTPQIVIDGERIGGSDALETYLARG